MSGRALAAAALLALLACGRPADVSELLPFAVTQLAPAGDGGALIGDGRSLAAISASGEIAPVAFGGGAPKAIAALGAELWVVAGGRLHHRASGAWSARDLPLPAGVQVGEAGGAPRLFTLAPGEAAVALRVRVPSAAGGAPTEQTLLALATGAPLDFRAATLVGAFEPIAALRQGGSTELRSADGKLLRLDGERWAFQPAANPVPALDVDCASAPAHLWLRSPGRRERVAAPEWAERIACGSTRLTAGTDADPWIATYEAGVGLLFHRQAQTWVVASTRGARELAARFPRLDPRAAVLSPERLFPLVGAGFLLMCIGAVLVGRRLGAGAKAAALGAPFGAALGTTLGVVELFLAARHGGEGALASLDVVYLGPLALIPLSALGAWSGGEAAGGPSARPIRAASLALAGAMAGAAVALLLAFGGAFLAALWLGPWACALGALLAYQAGRKERSGPQWRS